MAIVRSTALGSLLRGTGLLLDGEPFAFTIYELVGAEWCIGHFAKTAWPIRGASDFAMDVILSDCLAANASLYNEEQDLGLSGLRTAKLRHRPARFLRKYSIQIAI